ncbi:glycosyltransferase involved in cell wall biosynthesis [Chitinophaga niastensis]|uniref:Glycosyltransferase involved in cell wall biosynthesis n=1 Tax=Chitinophaga niastensis TaxID=536980 RepID=A0A2P8HBY8_CHINA|nr:glycosyltransferase family 4 protein [Chitinophaga niastensis]PSL43738.1 glycosyltransferase involved in cell wall biosynthesis [Chitinophaga niastensis]
MTQTPKKINVLEAIRQGKIGGGESHVLDLVSYLDKQRFKPVVLSFTDGPMMQSLQQMGVPGYVIHTEKPFDIRVWKQVKDFLRKQEIDIVHVHGTRANTNVLWAARTLKLPVIYTIHGWSFHDDLPFFKRMARIVAEKIITFNTRLNITVSDANQYTGHKALGAFKSVVVKNGVNLRRFNASATYPDVKAAYGIPEHHLVLGYIVRITGQKDPLGMIRAFAAVYAARPDVTLLMIGEGDLKDAAVQLAKDLQVDSRIVFDNFRTDVPAVLHAIDIYCLPSLWEGFPIGVLEAMAMGKAVIASDVDGTKEAIQHEVTGLLVPPKDTPALAEAIIRLVDDTQLRQELQTNARNSIIANFDAKIMTGKIETLYQQLLTPTGVD